jgi:hypothetical protein
MASKDIRRDEMLARIRENISSHGQHLYSVFGGASPVYVYSIGLSEDATFELIYAGIANRSNSEASEIVNALAAELRAHPQRRQHYLKKWGYFTLKPVHASWSELLLLGAHDYYQKTVSALQVIPKRKTHTIEHADMSKAWSTETATVWKWAKLPWRHTVPESSVAFVDEAVAFGREAVTQIIRMEIDQWEMISDWGQRNMPKECYCLSLGTVLAVDDSLLAALRLDVKEGLLRTEPDQPWKRFKESDYSSETL